MDYEFDIINTGSKLDIIIINVYKFFNRGRATVPRPMADENPPRFLRLPMIALA